MENRQFHGALDVLCVACASSRCHQSSPTKALVERVILFNIVVSFINRKYNGFAGYKAKFVLCFNNVLPPENYLMKCFTHITLLILLIFNLVCDD